MLITSNFNSSLFKSSIFSNDWLIFQCFWKSFRRSWDGSTHADKSNPPWALYAPACVNDPLLEEDNLSKFPAMFPQPIINTENFILLLLWIVI